jgi:hypothetical protein
MRPAPQILLRCLTTGGAALSFLLAFSACAPRPQRAVSRPGEVTPPMVVGEIAIVDEEKQFVLIDLDSNLYVPPANTPLRSTNGAGKTAHLRVSPEQKRPFIAADIIDGQPAMGDKVVQ